MESRAYLPSKGRASSDQEPADGDSTGGGSKSESSRGWPALALVLPFLLLLSAAMGVTGWLSLRYIEQAIDQLATQVRQEMTWRIQDYLYDYLQTPHLINEINSQALDLGRLNERDSELLGRHFRGQLDTFPNVSFIFWGSRLGGAAGAGRRDDGTVTVDSTPTDSGLGLVPGPRFEYAADSAGRRGELLRTDPGFDSRQRPWFQAAAGAGRPVWSTVYPLFFDQSLAIAASQPVWNADGSLRGVFGVDLRLAGIQSYLSRLKVGETGHTFIIERSGHLIASSTDEGLLVDPRLDQDWQRRHVSESREPLVRESAKVLHQRFGGFSAIDRAEPLTLDVLDERFYIEVAPLRDGRGIDWLIVIIIPQADYAAPLIASRKRTVSLALAAVLLATLMGLLTARWLTDPIRRLSQAATKLSSGQLDERVTAGGTREIDRLAGAFNSMADQLQGAIGDLEARVADRTAQLREAKEAAEAADQAKSRFLANVSHELRTPLSAILGYSELLAEVDLAPGTSRAYLDTVRRQGRHLSRLLGDLIDLDGIEAGRFELHPSTFSLARLLAQLRSVFGRQAAAKGLDLSITHRGEVPWELNADATRLQQILSNLLSNAIHYSSQGRVELHYSAQPVAEAVNREDGVADLRFDVVDSGMGIAEADRDKLFQRFVRLAAGEAARGTGFGLGLVICRQLSELMGGSIEVESTLGEGSRFSVTVKAESCRSWSASSPSQVLPRDSGTSPLAEGRVLIVEDSTELRRLCCLMVERWGLRAETARDGKEAVSLASTARFDVILMDWHLPAMDGLEATTELRRRGVLSPVIALTAAAEPGDRERCLAAGCSHYLIKPIDFHHLYALLANLLGARPVRSSHSATDRGVDESSVEDDPELAALTRRLLTKLPERLRDAKTALEEGRWQDLADTAHQLAGTAGSFDLHDISDAAGRLEAAAEAGRKESCRRRLRRLDETISAAVASGSES